MKQTSIETTDQNGILYHHHHHHLFELGIHCYFYEQLRIGVGMIIYSNE